MISIARMENVKMENGKDDETTTTTETKRNVKWENMLNLFGQGKCDFWLLRLMSESCAAL